MKDRTITAVGIDVSKGKNTIAVRRSGGEVVLTPFSVEHNSAGLSGLVKTLRNLDGDVRIVMEHTGMYWRPIALALKEVGFFVSVVKAMLIHDFSDNSLRKVKTGKADSMKIANYALSFWAELRDYSPEDETRQMLKMQTRLYLRTKKSSVVLRNGLISLLDQTFPGVNTHFDSRPKRSNGHFKWVDFLKRFWHKDCVAGISLAAFSDAYRKWCARSGYRLSQSVAEKFHAAARNSVATFLKNDSTKLLIVQAVDSLNAVYDTLHILRDAPAGFPAAGIRGGHGNAGRGRDHRAAAHGGDWRCAAVYPQGRSGGIRGHGHAAFPVWHIRLQIPPHLQARLSPSAKNPVHGRQHDPPALRAGQSHFSVYGQKAGRRQALLCLYRGRCCQVPAHLLCQGKGASGGAGC